MMRSFFILATVLELTEGGVRFTLEAPDEPVDFGRNVAVSVTAVAPAGVEVELPDLKPRLRGFASAEALVDEPVTGRAGEVTKSAEWKLVPEPGQTDFKIAPFLVRATRNGADASFIAGPVFFAAPADGPLADGSMSVSPEKDEPRLTLKRVGRWLLRTLLVLLFVVLPLVLLVRYLSRRVKEHRMRPIDRAWAELGRLVARRLPDRGKYKDFYIELTMVVRRYVQRKYGIRAPHLTTEEFLREILSSSAVGILGSRYERMRVFLESADLVKFAGVKATPELAADAVEKARGYLKDDNEREDAK